MPISMYAIALPTFQKHLSALDAILDKAEAYATSEQDRSGCASLGAALSRICSRFTRQVQLASDLAKGRRRKACRRAGAELRRYRDRRSPNSRRASPRRSTSSAPSNPSRWTARRRRDITIKVGPRRADLFRVRTTCCIFALPNFYFHARPPTTSCATTAWRSASAISCGGRSAESESPRPAAALPA